MNSKRNRKEMKKIVRKENELDAIFTLAKLYCNIKSEKIKI